MYSDQIWLAVGLAGQGIFAARFWLQWLVSERTGRSVIPVGFWYCSLLGGVTLLFYAIHRRDIVFVIGQGSGLLIYFRNLFLIRKENLAKSISSAAVHPTRP